MIKLPKFDFTLPRHDVPNSLSERQKESTEFRPCGEVPMLTTSTVLIDQNMIQNFPLSCRALSVIKPKQHRKSKGSESYHKRIQKKWDKRFKNDPSWLEQAYPIVFKMSPYTVAKETQVLGRLNRKTEVQRDKNAHTTLTIET